MSGCENTSDEAWSVTQETRPCPHILTTPCALSSISSAICIFFFFMIFWGIGLGNAGIWTVGAEYMQCCRTVRSDEANACLVSLDGPMGRSDPTVHSTYCLSMEQDMSEISEQS